MSNSSPRKILFIAPQPFFLNRGTPINVRAMVETLADEGFEVHLLAFPFGESIEHPNITIFRSAGLPGVNRVPIGPSWQKMFLDIPLSLRALALQRKNKYDMIHGIEEGAFIAGIASMLFRVPFVFDMDSSMSEQLQTSGFLAGLSVDKVFSKLERFFIKRSAAVLTVCEALSDKARSLVPDAKVVQIEDFPFGPACQSQEETIDQLRKEFSISKEQTSFLYTGNFEAYQGLKLLLESFAVVVKNTIASGNACPRLLLVGGGELDGEAVQEHRAIARSLAIEEHVLFTGSRPAEEMGSWMSLADVLVSPRAEGENTPLKLYSYMEAGKVIVATEIRSHTQVLSADTAFLAEALPESFALALEAALPQTELQRTRCQKIAEAAKELVDSRYSEREFKRKLVEMYRNAFGLENPSGTCQLGDGNANGLTDLDSAAERSVGSLVG